MRTTEEILSKEREIIEAAESNCLMHEYYNNLIAEKDRHSALAFKYGMVTMNLAQQINELKNRIENI